MTRTPAFLFTICLLRSAVQPVSAQEASPTRLPTVIVTETNLPPGEIREDQPVGPNEQPEWTTRRRFSTTRIYVSPPWQMEFEQWWQGEFPREGKSDHLFERSRLFCPC